MRQGFRAVMILAGAMLAMTVGSAAQAATKPKPKAAAAPEVRSEAALVVDGDNGKVLYERKAGKVAPIASITKLMTALVVIDGQQPLDEVIEVTKADVW